MTTKDTSTLDVLLWIVVLCMFAATHIVSCSRGYDLGYDAHRRDVCQRSGGVWVQCVDDDRKRACARGER